jgi:dihydrofolate reductase
MQGRRTYQVSAEARPTRSGCFADWINSAQKYVVSDTLAADDVTAWNPTTIIRGADLLKEVSALRKRPGGDIYIYGSLSLVRTLLAANMVDELLLMIEPITLGGGKTLFETDGQAREFKLVSAETAKTGVQVCRYQPAG